MTTSLTAPINTGTKPPSAPPKAHQQIQALVNNIGRAFVGKEAPARQAVLALVSGGHILLEDVPGVGKTLLAKALAKSLSADFKRIQFTADLLPSDITGVTIFSQNRGEFIFRPGPIFTQVLLGDEINRATPRTQSSLLEAMEENRVTVDGNIYPLEPPFFVMATQNPVELEGTYPLPFAQMDRFMTRIGIGYLDRTAEIRMLQEQQKTDPLDRVEAIMNTATLLHLQEQVRAVSVEPDLQGYIIDLVDVTRHSDQLEYGASPRAALDLQRYSQAIALAAGRDFVLPDDIKLAAPQVLPHRLIARKGARSVTLKPKETIEHLIQRVEVPV